MAITSLCIAANIIKIIKFKTFTISNKSSMLFLLVDVLDSVLSSEIVTSNGGGYSVKSLKLNKYIIVKVW